MEEIKKKLDISLKFSSLFKVLKRLFLIWIIVAIILGIATSFKVYLSSNANGSVSGTINFSFDGIEEGVDPSGNKFDVYEMKSSSNVKAVLETIGLDTSDEYVEEIKNNISIDGTVPDNIISSITNYSSVVGSDGINSYTSINDTSYNPTQFTITMKYKNAGVSKNQGSEILNALIDNYKTYFYDTYGYNKSIGESIVSINYDEYDYSEAVEMIDSSLNSLKVYVDSLASDDNTRFSSIQTGYSFSDISDAIETLRSENIGWISSYIESNNITKNKTNLINYYQYKIEDETRSKQSYQEQLNNVLDAIDKYQKTNTVVLGVGGSDTEEYSYSQSSETYDTLITSKVSYQTSISKADENIKRYKERINDLKSSSNSTGNVETVESYFEDLEKRVNAIVHDLNTTATEYYQDVALYNAYQVVNYSNTSVSSIFSTLISSASELIAYQLVLLSLYILISLILAVLNDNGIKIKSNRKAKVQSKWVLVKRIMKTIKILILHL